MTRVFIHGLDSSSQGTKARYFKEYYPDMLVGDYTGPLAKRMARLEQDLAGLDDLVLVGSSFGGLMATIFAIEHPERVARAVLLAPTLNFPDFLSHINRRTPVATSLYIGRLDVVTPPVLVVPVAQAVFTNLRYQVVEDDHFFDDVFLNLPWPELLY